MLRQEAPGAEGSARLILVQNWFAELKEQVDN